MRNMQPADHDSQQAALVAFHAALFRDVRDALNAAAAARPGMSFVGPVAAAVDAEGTPLFDIAIRRREADGDVSDRVETVRISGLWPLCDMIAALLDAADDFDEFQLQPDRN